MPFWQSFFSSWPPPTSYSSMSLGPRWLLYLWRNVRWPRILTLFNTVHGEKSFFKGFYKVFRKTYKPSLHKNVHFYFVAIISVTVKTKVFKNSCVLRIDLSCSEKASCSAAAGCGSMEQHRCYFNTREPFFKLLHQWQFNLSWIPYSKVNFTDTALRCDFMCVFLLTTFLHF